MSKNKKLLISIIQSYLNNYDNNNENIKPIYESVKKLIKNITIEKTKMQYIVVIEDWMLMCEFNFLLKNKKQNFYFETSYVGCRHSDQNEYDIDEHTCNIYLLNDTISPEYYKSQKIISPDDFITNINENSIMEDDFKKVSIEILLEYLYSIKFEKRWKDFRYYAKWDLDEEHIDEHKYEYEVESDEYVNNKKYLP